MNIDINKIMTNIKNSFKESLDNLKKRLTEMKGYNKEQWVKWIKEAYRGVIAAVLIIILFGILFAGCADSPDLNNPYAGTGGMYKVEGLKAKGGVNGDYQVNVNKEINAQIKAFFNNYAQGNIEELKKIIVPLDDNQANLVVSLSQYIEAYTNIGVYSKKLPDKDAYLVSVYHETKFKDIDTRAPGLTIFYIRRDDAGNYIIDNSSDSMMEESVANFIASFRTEEDVIELASYVNGLSTKALQEDEKLYDFVANTYQKIYTDYYAAVQAAADAKAAEEAAAKAEAEAKAKAEAEAKAAEEEKANHTFTNGSTVYATDEVNVRDAGSTDGQLVFVTETGEALTMIEVGEEWSKVRNSLEYEGYIKNEFIQNKKPE